jgi:chloramphenicol 3-O-phosphotransferase
MLNESVHDNAALKFVFLAGGPGSGKNYIANELFGIEDGRSFGSSGMKIVSLDAIFEKLLEKKGLPKDLGKIPRNMRDEVMSEHPNSLREKARKIMKKQLALYANQGLGIIFDGMGRVPYAYADRKRDMEELGYDTHLIFVDTPLRTALERNSKRERRLPTRLLAKLHRAIKANKEAYQHMFGDHMTIVDNSKRGGVTDELRNKINKIISEPVRNPIGQEFLQSGGVRKIKEKPKHTWASYSPKRHPSTDSQADGYKDYGSYDDFFSNSKTPQSFSTQRTISDPFDSPYSDAIPWWNMNKSNKSGNSDQFDLRLAMGKNADPTQYTPQPLPTLKAALQGAEKPPKTRNAAKPAPKGPPVADKPRGTPVGAKAVNPKVPKNNGPLDKRIHNPETGNDILLTTALGYPPGHPMRQAAERMMKK